LDYISISSFVYLFIHFCPGAPKKPNQKQNYVFPFLLKLCFAGFFEGTEYYVMYLALSAAGEGRQQMGAIVPVGINRADVWVDTPLEARWFHWFFQ